MPKGVPRSDLTSIPPFRRPQAVDGEPGGGVADMDGERVQSEERGLPQVLHERSLLMRSGEGALPRPRT